MTWRAIRSSCPGASAPAWRRCLPPSALPALKISRGVLQTEFTTRNTLLQDAQIRMQLLHGPFRDLWGEWRFDAIGTRGSRVYFRVEFEFKNRLSATAFNARIRGAVRHHHRCLRAARPRPSMQGRHEGHAVADRSGLRRAAARHRQDISPGARFLRRRCPAAGRVGPRFSRAWPSTSRPSGIFGRVVRADHPLQAGDRVEIYRRWGRIPRRRAAPARNRPGGQDRGRGSPRPPLNPRGSANKSGRS